MKPQLVALRCPSSAPLHNRMPVHASLRVTYTAKLWYLPTSLGWDAGTALLRGCPGESAHTLHPPPGETTCLTEFPLCFTRQLALPFSCRKEVFALLWGDGLREQGEEGLRHSLPPSGTLFFSLCSVVPIVSLSGFMEKEPLACSLRNSGVRMDAVSWDFPVRSGKQRRCRSRSDSVFQGRWEDGRPDWGWGCEQEATVRGWLGVGPGARMIPEDSLAQRVAEGSELGGQVPW